MGEEEGAGAEVVKLAAIVALNPLDRAVKLRADIGEEISKSRKHVRLKSKRKCP